jgi:peptide/nickel transport system substrate-binding protein
MTLDLEPKAKFQDGTAATASVVAPALRSELSSFLGAVFKDIRDIQPSADERQIKIAFARPSPFLLESLEASIKKPGGGNIGTGPFVVSGTASSSEIRSNIDYYLGRPVIDRIVVSTYPTIRTAWAELLRNNIDMLYDVGADAGGSVPPANVFTFTRPYQYVVVLNVRSPKLKSAEIRRALNAAIDRTEIVRTGFDGHATAASGLVWPQNWAVAPTGDRVSFNPQAATALLKSHPPLRFTCLVPTDYERVALVVQRQLAAVGVTMDVETVAQAGAFQALAKSSFEAVLTDVVGGSSLLRPYLYWHSSGTLNPGAVGSPAVDAAFDRIRNSASEDDYRAAVANLQKVTVDDPPAIYLAWGQRSRAISNRFDVPVEPGRDVLATLRLWKPATDPHATRN